MSFLTGTNAELLYVNTASATAKASFTTEVTINDTTGMGQQASLPPYFFGQVPYANGKALRIIARGILSSTATPTYTFSLRLGAAASTSACLALGSTALTTGTTVTNQLFEFQGEIIARNITGAAGANSTVQGMGLIASGGLATPFSYGLFAGAASPGTVATYDNSITNFINFNVACSASSASNTITLLQLEVWGLN